MKIQIIGYSGAGKSTLAKRLAEHYQIPYLYMDSVKFYDNMQERSVKHQNTVVKEFLEQNESWVIDGNYYDIAEERYELCDEIYFLDYSRWFCLKEALKRFLKGHNRFRESLGCVESFDMSFFWWIVYEGHTPYWQREHLKHMHMCKNYHHFKKRKELLAYLHSIGIETE